MNIQDEVNQVVIHELIHAFDECRAANLDWTNCPHHACSEVSLFKLMFALLLAMSEYFEFGYFCLLLVTFHSCFFVGLATLLAYRFVLVT